MSEVQISLMKGMEVIAQLLGVTVKEIEAAVLERHRGEFHSVICGGYIASGRTGGGERFRVSFVYPNEGRKDLILVKKLAPW